MTDDPTRAARPAPRLATTILLLATALLALLMQGGLSGAAALPTSQIDIVTADGVKHRFAVEIADNDEARTKGLMYRDRLAADAGMLFDFKEQQEVAFWMKNTLIPLDMLFIDRTGRIVTIAERAVPGSLAPIGSGAPIRAVLEVNGGTVHRLGIRPGDRVVNPIFAR